MIFRLNIKDILEMFLLILLYRPVARFDLWSQTHFRLWLWGSTKPSAYQQSSNPEGRRFCQQLQFERAHNIHTFLALQTFSSSFIKIERILSIKALHVIHILVLLNLTLIAIRLSLLLTLLLLELHVTMMEHCSSELVDAHLLLIVEAQNVQ